MKTRTGLVLAFALLFVSPVPLRAFRPTGLIVVVPIIARIPGALETQWQTDLFIGNHSSVLKTITMTFYVAGGPTLIQTTDIGPYSTVSLPDVVLSTFGLTNASGQLILTNDTESEFEARARVYNVGNPAGQFGQSVQGLGLGELRRQGFLYELSGINGTRVNCGVANPSDHAISVNVSAADSNGTQIASIVLPVLPHQTAQNDIFTMLGIAPRDHLQVNFQTFDDVIYAYATEVRNDTGDSIFIIGTSPNS